MGRVLVRIVGRIGWVMFELVNLDRERESLSLSRTPHRTLRGLHQGCQP
jgi:hypothetical protein